MERNKGERNETTHVILIQTVVQRFFETNSDDADADLAEFVNEGWWVAHESVTPILAPEGLQIVRVCRCVRHAISVVPADSGDTASTTDTSEMPAVTAPERPASGPEAILTGDFVRAMMTRSDIIDDAYGAIGETRNA